MHLTELLNFRTSELLQFWYIRALEAASFSTPVTLPTWAITLMETDKNQAKSNLILCFIRSHYLSIKISLYKNNITRVLQLQKYFLFPIGKGWMAIIFYFRYYFNELELKAYFNYQIIFSHMLDRGPWWEFVTLTKLKSATFACPRQKQKSGKPLSFYLIFINFAHDST